jgi:hypothetical protein
MNISLLSYQLALPLLPAGVTIRINLGQFLYSVLESAPTLLCNDNLYLLKEY